MNATYHPISKRCMSAIAAAGLVGLLILSIGSVRATEFDHSSLESFSVEPGVHAAENDASVNDARARSEESVVPVSPSHEPTVDLHIPKLTVRTNVTSRTMESPKLVSPNIVPEKKDNGPSTVDEWKIQLNKAREARAEKDYELAANMLIFLLESATPASINETAMFELAQITEDAGQFVRAQQIYAQFINQFPKSPKIPETYLRRGLLFRKMGAYRQAKNSFFSAMSQSLAHTDRRIALHAQTEIADTYMLEGDHETAVNYYRRLIQQSFDELNVPFLHYKMISAISMLGDPIKTGAEAVQFLTKHGSNEYAPEVRFILAKSLKDRQLNDEATREILALMKAQKQQLDENPDRYADWIYWQQRAGNEIANNLYRDGEYQNALHVYTRLAEISEDPEWQLPVLYQIGLCSEHLDFTKRAVESYESIVTRGGQVPADKRPDSLSTVIEMASWRLDQIKWRGDMRAASEGVQNQLDSTPTVSPESEEVSFRSMATIYSAMPPDAAVSIFAEMDDDSVIGIARYMPSYKAAIVLSKLANVSEEDARRAAYMSEMLNLEVANGGTTEQ